MGMEMAVTPRQWGQFLQYSRGNGDKRHCDTAGMGLWLVGLPAVMRTTITESVNCTMKLYVKNKNIAECSSQQASVQTTRHLVVAEKLC